MAPICGCVDSSATRVGSISGRNALQEQSAVSNSAVNNGNDSIDRLTPQHRSHLLPWWLWVSFILVLGVWGTTVLSGKGGLLVSLCRSNSCSNLRRSTPRPLGTKRHARRAFEKTVQAEQSETPRRVRKATSRVVLFTAIFGRPPPNFFPIFLKSAEHSGVDYIIVGGGDNLPPLPANVKQINIRWGDMIDLLSDRLFGGNPLPEIQHAKPYKTIDTKPAFGYLFREYIAEYEFWGHIDNDMIMGNVAHFVAPLLDKYDIITPLDRDCTTNCDRTWGPFTLYRNVPKITELFKTGPTGLYNTYNNPATFFFDEWGGGTRRYYNQSMSAIINLQVKPLHLRHYHYGIPVGWDGECHKSADIRACECTFSRENNSYHVIWNRTALGYGGKQVYPVLLCHFQFGKHETARIFYETPDTRVQEMLDAPTLVWSYYEGFHLPR